MYSYGNRTVFDFPLTWNRTRFEASRSKLQQARRLIDISVNVQFEKRLRQAYLENITVEKNITECHANIYTQEKKFNALDNLTEVALQSLPDYFDKRMEQVRSSIQEHFDAIQRIIHEETEHWKEIHSAIDQNLITSADIHAHDQQKSNAQNIPTIDEGDEENASHLMNANTVTSILTQMIRKSQSKRQSATPMDTEKIIAAKQEQHSVIVPSFPSKPICSTSDTTYFVKLEDTTHHEASEHEPIAIVPIRTCPTTSTIEMTASPVFSQPNPPARLYFSPTLLEDEEDSDKVMANVLSPLDQNQISVAQPKVALRRLGQTFVLDNLKSEEVNQSQHSTHSNNFTRPNIVDDAPILVDAIQPDENNENQHVFAVPEGKPTRRTRAVIKAEPRPTRVTRNTQKPADTTRRQTRKRKQSATDETDPKSTTLTLRKRKAVSTLDTTEKKDPKPEKKKRKPRKRKLKNADENEIPIREPSPLPIIDRSKHYSTRFSTRSHRLNNFTLSVTNTEDDDDHHKEPKTRRTRTRTQTLKKSKTNHSDDDMDDQKVISKVKKSAKATTSKKTKKKKTNV